MSRYTMRRKQPETLHNKSFSAVVELVLKLSKYSAIKDIQNFVKNFPPTLADEFTSRLLPRLECPSAELLQSCIHPAVKTLDLNRCHAKITEQMCAVLPHLEVRKLELSVSVTNLQFSTKLVFFSYPFYCTDNIIQQLAVTCKSLQVLDIHEAVAVTDDCLSFMVQLQDLQDLNVTGTSLSDNAVAKLLFGLHKLRECKAKNMPNNANKGCSESLEKCTFDFVKTPVCLADHFPNVTCVLLSQVYAPDAVVSFGTLIHLKHFSIVYPYYYDSGMRGFVNKHGKNLLSFSIERVWNLDYLHFVTMCPNLRSLDLKNCYMSYAGMGDNRNLPHFQSVETLNVEYSYQWDPDFAFPFFDYSNLQHLIANCAIRTMDDTSLCRALIERDWLRELRTLELTGPVKLSIRSFMQLLESCPHLEKISNLGEWQMNKEDLKIITDLQHQQNLDIEIIAFEPYEDDDYEFIFTNKNIDIKSLNLYFPE